MPRSRDLVIAQAAVAPSPGWQFAASSGTLALARLAGRPGPRSFRSQPDRPCRHQGVFARPGAGRGARRAESTPARMASRTRVGGHRLQGAAVELVIARRAAVSQVVPSWPGQRPVPPYRGAGPPCSGKPTDLPWTAVGSAPGKATACAAPSVKPGRAGDQSRSCRSRANSPVGLISVSCRALAHPLTSYRRQDQGHATRCQHMTGEGRSADTERQF